MIYELSIEQLQHNLNLLHEKLNDVVHQQEMAISEGDIARFELLEEEFEEQFSLLLKMNGEIRLRLFEKQLANP